MRKITHQENVHRQELKRKQPKIPITIILNNIRSLHNVGSIFRTSDGAGIEKIWLCGITGFPPNNQIAKTALGAEDHVEWEYSEDIVNVIHPLKKKGYEIVVLEQTEQSIFHHLYKPKNSVCLIIGNEVEGVQQEVADLGDCSIEIEMAGIKNSLNVAVAFGIVAYHIRNQLLT
ncbi:MAG: RNA methyltransferase [Candidatus Omnitrophica bacterium]|nr:RNA methyltransferase [Candidatus Omnitrophota bacterium]